MVSPTPAVPAATPRITRYEWLAHHDLAFIQLASISLWLQVYECGPRRFTFFVMIGAFATIERTGSRQAGAADWGDLPDEAVIEAQRRCIETVELEGRLRAIEERLRGDEQSA